MTGAAATGSGKAMYNDGNDSALAMDTGKAQSADTAAMDNGQAQDALIANQANNSSTAQTGVTNNNGAGNAQTGLANNNGGSGSIAQGAVAFNGGVAINANGTSPTQVREVESKDNAPDRHG